MTSKIVKSDSQPKDAVSRNFIESEGGVVHKRVVDAKDSAGRILDSARLEAEKILAAAKDELAKAKLEAEHLKKKGYSEGESKGLAAVTEKLILLEKQKEKFFEDAEPEIVKLSMAIAEKVISRLAVDNVELIKNVVRQAIERTLGDRIVVRLNPEDHQRIMVDDAQFKDSIDKSKRIVFRADESISQGGCAVESEVGTIDARLETQLSAIKKALSL